MRAHKNQKDIYAPLTAVPLKILKKYDYKLPMISDQKLNKDIKEVCKEAGIKSSIGVIRISSGNKAYEYIPKWRIVTSHTAIKTFITLCGERGVSPKTVSEITGKSVQVILEHYYGIDKKTIQDQMVRAFG